MFSKKFSYVRNLLGLIMVLSMVLSACQANTPAATAVPTKEATQAPAVTEAPVATEAPAKYKEAPILKELVDKGELPALEERLPENPLVVDAAEIGQYGGTWRRGFLGPSDYNGYVRIVDEALVTFTPDGTK